MSIIVDIVAVLKANLVGVEVYSSVVPEDAAVPALAVQNIAFTSDRVIEGTKTKRWSQWRITVVAPVSALQSVIDQLELLDNTFNEYFQRMFVDLTLIEPKATTEPYQRAFVDMRVYKR